VTDLQTRQSCHCACWLVLLPRSGLSDEDVDAQPADSIRMHIGMQERLPAGQTAASACA
jgi:hypothetical protein